MSGIPGGILMRHATTQRTYKAVLLHVLLHVQPLLAAVPVLPVLPANQSSFIDPTTPIFARYTRLPGSPPSGRELTLVFSDEFNGTWLANRSWSPMQTVPREAENKWSATYQLNSDTYGETFLHPQMVSVSNGTLHLAGQQEQFGGAGYLGAQLTTWNKFCFQGGYLEVSTRQLRPRAPAPPALEIILVAIECISARAPRPLGIPPAPDPVRPPPCAGVVQAAR